MNEVLRKKIAALKAKAADRSVTEAEAIAAAEMAAEMMRSHGLSDEDVEFEEAAAPLKTKGQSPRDRLWGSIAICTNTCATLQPDWTPSILFIGRAPGPEIATYLVAVLNRAVDRAVEDFKKTPTYTRRRTLQTRRQAVHDFTVGIVARLRQRLAEMFEPSIDQDALNAAKRVRDLRIPDTVSIPKGGRTVKFGNAAESGFRAGDRIQLAHGVGGRSGAPLQIGGM